MTGLTLEKIQSIFKEREIKTVGEHRYFSVLVPLVQKKTAFLCCMRFGPSI